MTLSRLIRELQKHESKHGRHRVAADVESFFTGNGTWNICNVCKVFVEWVPLADDDGGTAVDSKGRERGAVQIVLRG